MRKMFFKPIKQKSWHVTVALMSLHVAFLSVCMEHPFLGASSDALIECNCGQRVMEVKC